MNQNTRKDLVVTSSLKLFIMKYIILTFLQFIQFIILDLFSLVYVFKKYEFNQFYSKNRDTGFIVKSHACYNQYGNVYYLTKWDAFFSINKHEC